MTWTLTFPWQAWHFRHVSPTVMACAGFDDMGLETCCIDNGDGGDHEDDNEP